MKFYAIRIIKSSIIALLLIGLFNHIRHLQPQSNMESFQSPIKVSINSTVAVVDEFDQISHTLQPFTTSLPHFPDDEARSWFLNSTYYQMYAKHCPNGSCEKNGFLFDNSEEHLQVHLALVKNGLYLNDDCGYKYSDQAIRRSFQSTTEASVIYDQAIIYTVPDGWSFQHFLDGIGPKLSHSRVYLDKYPDAKVILQQGMRFDRSVKEMWALLGVEESSRIVHYKPGTKLGARLLINPCRTAATHPKLWHDARHLYWSLAKVSQSSTVSSRNKLIYIQRTATNSKNQGRLIVNEQPFIEILRQYTIKSSFDFIQYDHSKQKGNIVNQIELFYQARVIIGVHGGAQSNMNFAQPGTTIIEIMPYRLEQPTIPTVCSLSHPNELKPCVGYIYYTQAQLLNLSYWILPTPIDQNGNLHVNLTRVERIFSSLT